MKRAAILGALLAACGGSVAGVEPEYTGPLACEVRLDDEYAVEAIVDDVVSFALLRWRQRVVAVRELDAATVTYTVTNLGEVVAVFDGALTVFVDGHEFGGDDCRPQEQP